MSAPAKIAAVAATVGIAVAAAAGMIARDAPDDAGLVTLPAGQFDYRGAGEFTQDGVPVNAPLVKVVFDHPVAMMKHQVSRSDYQRCVDAGACRAVAAPMPADAGRMPVVGVNWDEANAYAAWLSRETGSRYRLPTDAEWAYAAGSLFFDPTIVADGDAANPAARWIAAYESESAVPAPPDRHPRPFGAFGTNEHGFDDIRGNVWDWTSTCFARHATRDDVTATSELCGVRVVEGRHRAYLTDFIREPRGGSCSVGAPPANLGIRLVRDDGDGIGPRIVRAVRSLFSGRA